MSYAILRTAKLTSLGNVGGSAQHNFRERPTPNADAERTPSNTTSGAQSAAEVVAGVKARLETVPTVRKNAVLAVEYFIGASPEWFSQVNEKQREAYFDQAEKWLKARHGAENVIAVTRQYDETSPHICAYAVPIDPKGKLNCSHFLDGREKLSLMQTDFAERVGALFGLERGIEGSKATHKSIKDYYAELNKEPPQSLTISAAALEPRQYKRQGIMERLHITTRVESPEAVAERLTKAVQVAYAPALNAAKQYGMEKTDNAARAHELAAFRATATQARDLPLGEVLERLGAVPDVGDRHNFRTPTGRVTVTGSKFFNHDTGKGGGGAIDLVMAQTETDYKGAVNWLAGEFGTGAVLSERVARLKPEIEAAAKAPPSLEPVKAHQPDPAQWDRVRRYLVDKRGLDARRVDRLHAAGWLYADKYANAAFRLGDGEGVSLRGTGDKPFHGVRGQKVPFKLAATDKDSKQAAFVESPIDALSLRQMGFEGQIVATVGNSAKLAKALADGYRERGFQVVGAFDRDKAGEAMCKALGEHVRLAPKAKDWNEDVRGVKPEVKQQEQRRSDPDRGYSR